MQEKHIAYKYIILERVKGYGQHCFWRKLLAYYLYGNIKRKLQLSNTTCIPIHCLIPYTIRHKVFFNISKLIDFAE